jgi:hypothetical protein
MQVLTDCAVTHHTCQTSDTDDITTYSINDSEALETVRITKLAALLQLPAAEAPSQTFPSSAPSLSSRTFQCIFDRLTAEKEVPLIKYLQKFLLSSLKAQDSARVDRMGELRKAIKFLLDTADLKSWLVLVKLILCIEHMELDLNSQSLSIRYFWPVRDSRMPSLSKIKETIGDDCSPKPPSTDSSTVDIIPNNPNDQSRIFNSLATGAQWLSESVENYIIATEFYEDYLLNIVAGGDRQQELTRCSLFLGPDPFCFLIINSCLRQILGCIPDNTNSLLSTVGSPYYVMSINLLLILEVNFGYVVAKDFSLTMLGLKYAQANYNVPLSSGGDSGSPLVGRLLHSLLRYSQLSGSASGNEPQDCCTKIADHATRALAAGMVIFFPDPSDWYQLVEILSESLAAADSATTSINSRSSTLSTPSIPHSAVRVTNFDSEGVFSVVTCASLLLSLPQRAKHLILSSLFRHLRSPKCLSRVIPPNLRAVTSPFSGFSIYGPATPDRDDVALATWSKSSCVLPFGVCNGLPRIGDRVVPGPDWKYPADYLPDVYASYLSSPYVSPESVGVVIDIVEWELNPRFGAVVQWKNGQRHIYNCGYKTLYELSLYQQPVSPVCQLTKTPKVIPLKKLLTPEFVAKALQDLRPPTTNKSSCRNEDTRQSVSSCVEPKHEDEETMKLTKRGIFEFIIKHAPSDFLDTFKLRRNIQNLVKASDVQQTIKVYTQFYRCIASRSDTGNSSSGKEIVACTNDATSQAAKLYQLTQQMLTIISLSRQAETVDIVIEQREYSFSRLECEISETMSAFIYVLTGRLSWSDFNEDKFRYLKYSVLKATIRDKVQKAVEATVLVGRPDPEVLTLFVNIIGTCAKLLEQCISNLAFPLCSECLSPILTSLCRWQMLPSACHHRELFNKLVLNLEQLYRFLVAATSRLRDVDRTRIKFCSHLRLLVSFILGRIAGDLIYGGSLNEVVGNDFMSLHAHIFARYSSGISLLSSKHASGTLSKPNTETGAGALHTIISSKLLSKGFKEVTTLSGYECLGRNDFIDSAYVKFVNKETGYPVMGFAEPVFEWMNVYRNTKMKFPDNLKEAMMSVFLCSLYHTGYLDTIVACVELLKILPETMKLKPLKIFIEAWSVAEGVRNSYLSKKRVQQMSDGFFPVGVSVLATEYLQVISSRAQFLLRLEVTVPPTGVGRKLAAYVTELAPTESKRVHINDFIRAFDGTGAERTLISQIDSFINKAGVPLGDIHRHLLHVNEKAVCRTRGFHLISQALSALLSGIGNAGDDTSCCDMVCLLLQFTISSRASSLPLSSGDYYSPSIFSSHIWSGVAPSLSAPNDSGCGQITEIRSLRFNPGSEQTSIPGHFKDGVVGCCWTASKSLLQAFERIMSSLMNALITSGQANTAENFQDSKKSKVPEAGNVLTSSDATAGWRPTAKWDELMKMLICCCAIVIKEEDDDNVLKQIHAFDSLKVCCDGDNPFILIGRL